MWAQCRSFPWQSFQRCRIGLFAIAGVPGAGEDRHLARIRMRVYELPANPKYTEPLRTEFAPLYAAIDVAMDEATALGILQKSPPVGRVK